MPAGESEHVVARGDRDSLPIGARGPSYPARDYAVGVGQPERGDFSPHIADFEHRRLAARARHEAAGLTPPLDEAGNSVKAQKTIEAISKALGGNPYAVTSAVSKTK